MLLNEWRPHIEDGHVYKLVVVQEYRASTFGYHPRLLALICNAEWQKKEMPGSQGQYSYIEADREHDVEVSPDAFNDFEHLCSFAREVGAIMECEPATIIKAI